MRPMRARWLAAIAVPLLALGACGERDSGAADEAPDDEFAELALNPSEDREQQLYDAAVANGGEILVYTTLPVPEMEAQIAGFNERYPDIDVEFYRGGSSGGMITRVLTELAGDAFEADVLWTNDHVTYVLDANGDLADFESAYADNYDDAFRITDTSYPSYINYWMWAYNTDLIDDPATLPQSYDDLLDPEWEGRFSLAMYADWFYGLWDILGDERAEQFFEQLGAQNPTLGPQFTPALLPVIQGERALTISTVSGVLRGRQEEGAPLEGYFPDDTTVARTVPVAIFDEGGNPEGGLLFAEYVLSGEGQELLKDRGRVPGSSDVPPEPKELRPDNAELIDYGSFIPEEDEWVQRMEEYLQGG